MLDLLKYDVSLINIRVKYNLTMMNREIPANCYLTYNSVLFKVTHTMLICILDQINKINQK